MSKVMMGVAGNSRGMKHHLKKSNLMQEMNSTNKTDRQNIITTHKAIYLFVLFRDRFAQDIKNSLVWLLSYQMSQELANNQNRFVFVHSYT